MSFKPTPPGSSGGLGEGASEEICRAAWVTEHAARVRATNFEGHKSGSMSTSPQAIRSGLRNPELPNHGCLEFKDWLLQSECLIEQAKGCTSLSTHEEEWLGNALSETQPDKLGVWVKKTSKGKKKSKLPRSTQDNCLLLRRWSCNASKNCGCKAEVMLIRRELGYLCLLQKVEHDHEQHIPHPEWKKQPLPRKLQVELTKYLDSDMLIPKIMQQLESCGFDFEGVTKKKVRNFLTHQRKKVGCRGTRVDVEAFVQNNLFDESRQFGADDVFVVDWNLPKEVDEESFFREFRLSLSCPKMVEWIRQCTNGTCPRQLTIDATFKIITDDKFILMASGITDANCHWFPFLYSLVPTESQDNTMFHLSSIWKLLKDDARQFFEGIYILKDAGAGIHAGVRAFGDLKALKWHQQDCYAHLSRVDGNLQQACKKYHVPANIASTIAIYVKRISFSPTKEIKNALLEKLEVECSAFEEFVQWWKRTYGGPFRYWARCDAPHGYPVSNQGHESNNKTFKKVHMPGRSTQRRLHIHRALGPLKNAISSLVREKRREYTFAANPCEDVPQKLWEDVDMLLMSADWSFRQEVDCFTLLPSQGLLKNVHGKAQTLARAEISSWVVHSNGFEEKFLLECELHMHRLLALEAKQIVEVGLQPAQEETLPAYCNRWAKWTIIAEGCTCCAFIDKGTCKHYLALQVHKGTLAFPQHLKVMQKSRHDYLRMRYLKDLTRKQKEVHSASEQRKKRFKLGMLELHQATQPSNNDSLIKAADL
eukprot:scaffold152_cov492-Pavlova_lutheri.AAC.1